MDWHDVVESITVLDHHQTAKETVGHLEFCHIDLNESGASLAWKYFFPDEEMPLVVQYAKDRDLWEWKLHDSKAITLFMEFIIKQCDGDISRIDDVLFALENSLVNKHQFVFDKANLLMEFRDQIVDDLCANNLMTVPILNYEVPGVNSPVFQSEIGNKLLQDNKNAPFSAVTSQFYDENKDKIRTRYSLRSELGRMNVGEIARICGGGGHRFSAGFSV